MSVGPSRRTIAEIEAIERKLHQPELSPNAGAARPASSPAERLLPIPGVPVSVTKHESPTSSLISDRMTRATDRGPAIFLEP